MDINIKIAIISACSAIIGAIFSQVVGIIKDYLVKKHDYKKLLREKYELLAELVTRNEEWSSNILEAANLNELSKLLPTDARRAMVLANIYFPCLQEPCQNYLNSCVEFKLSLINNYGFIEAQTVGTQAIAINNADVQRAVKKLHLARQAIDDEIIKWAKKYTNA